MVGCFYLPLPAMILSCFGDSITYGMHDEIEGGRFYRLQKDFSKTLPRSILYNNGVPGDTSVGLLQRFFLTCQKQKPTHIFVAIGTNDSRTFGTPLSVFASTIEQIFDQACRVTPKVGVIGLPGLSTSKVIYAEYGYTIQGIHTYNNVLKNISGQYRFPFLDVEKLLEEEDFHDDGLHPNASGHQKLYLSIKNFFHEYFL